MAASQSVAIFFARESVAQILRTTERCLRACGQVESTIDLLINGNGVMAEKVSDLLPNHYRDSRSLIRVWDIAEGDKSHAWNTYIHSLWPNTTHSIFLDGYVEVNTDAFGWLDLALRENPEAYAASGVTYIGRTAKRQTEWQMKYRGIHGGLHALRRECVEMLRELPLRLPLGIYRTDPTMSSVIKYDGDPASNDFYSNRVVVEPRASYWRRPAKWWRSRGLREHFRRMCRQAQGDLEQAAVKQFFAIEKRRPADLPRTASQLVLEWIDRHPSTWRRMVCANPLRYHATTKLKRNRDWSRIKTAPRLVKQIGSSSDVLKKRTATCHLADEVQVVVRRTRDPSKRVTN